MSVLKRRIILLIFLLPLWALLKAQAVKDTLYFTNGSMVIGELKKVKLGVMTFDPDDANDITVQLRKIKRIEARTKIFRIETIQDKLIYGVLAADPDPFIINVIQSGDTNRISCWTFPTSTGLTRPSCSVFPGILEWVIAIPGRASSED